MLPRTADGRLFHTVSPWKAKLRWPTNVINVCTLCSRHIQSMPTAVEDVLELSPPARKSLADMEVRGRGCISLRGPQSWKWSFVALEASGGCAWLEWCARCYLCCKPVGGKADLGSLGDERRNGRCIALYIIFFARMQYTVTQYTITLSYKTIH